MFSLTSFVHHYGFLGMFLLVVLENLGIPIPTEPAYVVGQALISHDRVPYWLILLVLTVGHTVGSLLSYMAGRRIASQMKDRANLTDVQHRIARWFDRYGMLTVVGTRLIGYVRPWSSYVAGVAEVPLVPFFMLSLVGTVILNIVCLAFTTTLVYFWIHYTSLRILIALSGLVGLLLVVIFGIHEKRSNRRKKEVGG